ncbi:MAG: prohibitin family protein [Bacteroidales bacterium]
MAQQQQQNDPNMKRIIPIAIIIGIIIFLAISWSSITVTIDSGHAGVLFKRFGGGLDIDNPRPQGFHLIAPWNKMTIYEIRKKELQESMDVLSSNGLAISMDMSLWFMPQYKDLGRLHDQLGINYVESMVKPGLRSATRTVIGRYTPEQLYAESRDVIQDEIQQETERLLNDKYIHIDRTLIRSIKLPPTIKAAIERKLEQEQQTLQYEFKLRTAAKEAERQKIEAEGKATANRIVSQSLTDNILREKGIQATQKLSESENAKIIVIGSGDDGLPIILGGNN